MKNTFFILYLFMICSCTDNSMNKVNGSLSSKIEADPVSESELKKELEEVEKEEQKRLKEIEANQTTMSFDRIKHDFGNVIEDSENPTTFIVKNTGKNPLIIESVTATCGCTTPSKPEKPILPGKSDKIEVVFHPKVGQLEEQTKTVTVKANTEPSMSVLTITAFVNPKK